MEDIDLIRIILESARELIERDPELLTNDVHEQSLTHRLGVYIENRIPDWNVDCEYNRNGETIKRLPVALDFPIPNITDQMGAKIKPDVIVHKRMEKNNLLVVEVKKLGNDEVDNDDWKLRGMTRPGGQYEYQLGIHLIFDGEKAKLSNIRCYKLGAPSGELDAVARELK